MVTEIDAQPIFYFDFGSPNAFLAHRIIPQIESRVGKRFRYIPVLLGGIFKLTGNQAPMMAYAGIPSKLAYERLEMQRYIARHNLTSFQMNPHFPVNTLSLMRCAVAAERAGCLAAYVEAMFHFMWEDPRKLDDANILRATILEAELAADALLANSIEQSVKERLMINTQDAVDKGVFGIPSFLVQDALYFGKDQLDTIERVLTDMH